VKKFSKGMLQRLGLAQALMHNPELLILDEPTDGVDPVGRSEMRQTLQRLKTEGKTIFINSHLLQEIELVCDRVAILVKGEVRREGLVAEITRRQQTEIELTVAGSEGAIQGAIGLQQVAPMKPLGENRFSIVLQIPDQAAVDKCIDGLRAAGVRIEELARKRDTLEEAFLGIVAKPS
jgi:ABC-2 type transport system ATP-binding protein